MKRTIIILLFLLNSVFAQQIGQWKIYSDMKDVKGSVNSENAIWANTDGGAFMYNAAEGSYLALTKASFLL